MNKPTKFLMNSNVYEINLTFKKVKCNIQIIPDEHDCYQLLLKTTKPLTTKDRTALRSYLHEEGYIDEAFKTYRS